MKTDIDIIIELLEEIRDLLKPQITGCEHDFQQAQCSTAIYKVCTKCGMPQY